MYFTCIRYSLYISLIIYFLINVSFEYLLSRREFIFIFENSKLSFVFLVKVPSKAFFFEELSFAKYHVAIITVRSFRHEV